jgi:4-hydroxy-3-methylbut-2-enyl diphosphate reductase
VVQRVLLASPRGYCAGVERAVETVAHALGLEEEVYVRGEIVHNSHVVRDLRDRGALFVADEDEAPEGATLILSAHGVPPVVHRRSRERGQRTIDATCPLVTRVHTQARRFAAEGYRIVLIGHAGHDEVIGTMGEAPAATFLVESVEDVEALSFSRDDKLAYITQTTLSVEEAAEIVAALKRRFPDIRAPKREDICYATSNRQRAVKALLPEIQLMLVIGSENSSNSNRLVDVARAGGVAAHLIEDAGAIDERWLDGVDTVGVSSGASAPERLVKGVCDWFRRRGVERIEQLGSVEEHVRFRLPAELRRGPDTGLHSGNEPRARRHA